MTLPLNGCLRRSCRHASWADGDPARHNTPWWECSIPACSR